MIIRIFNVSIKEDLKEEFENEFEQISSNMRDNCEGLISLQLGYPTKVSPNDYTMISTWQDEDALISFVGEQWHEVFIPDHMQKYPTKYSVQHYIIK